MLNKFDHKLLTLLQALKPRLTSSSPTYFSLKLMPGLTRQANYVGKKNA